MMMWRGLSPKLLAALFDNRRRTWPDKTVPAVARNHSNDRGSADDLTAGSRKGDAPAMR